jgi:hypothetical protein
MNPAYFCTPGHRIVPRIETLSLTQSLRLFSVYHAANGTKFWIITEADRSATTILLPEDY